MKAASSHHSFYISELSRFTSKEQSEECAFSGLPISPGLATAKIEKNSEVQGLFGKNVYFCGEKGEKHHVVQRNGAT